MRCKGLRLQHQALINELFGDHSGWASEDTEGIVTSPNFGDIKSLALLLRSNPREEALQLFFAQYPQFLLGLSGTSSECDLAFLTKPPVGTNYFADYAVLSVSQGGASISLFEIEPSSSQLFTQKGTPARRLQGALGQIWDWHQWIEANRDSFVNDMLTRALSAPFFHERDTNNSFRLRNSSDVEQSWRAFGGMNCYGVGYYIVIGRWCNLSKDHRERLVMMNRNEAPYRKIYTYDQLARRAFIRPNLALY